MSYNAQRRTFAERCPDCGSGFKSLKRIGHRRHLEALPKRDSTGTIVTDQQGNPVICGGSPRSWDKGNRS